ncbi:MAG: N-acetylglucosamine-6-phosphate deacetylase [Thermodesulfovibrionales bacterium]
MNEFSGFVDLHTHGIGRCDCRAADPRTVLRMAELHGKSGTRALLVAVYPDRTAAMRDVMGAVRRAMEAQQAAGSAYRSGTAAATILGVHLEGPFLNPSFAGALEKTAFLRPTVSALAQLLSGYEDIVRVITLAPELPGALKVIEKAASQGIRVNMGHSGATFRQALEGRKAGASGISHIFNAMRPFHHREPGLAGLGLFDQELYVEVIADGVHLHPCTLGIIFRMKRLDRIIIVSDSVAGKRAGKAAVYARKGLLAGSALPLRGAAKLLQSIGVPDAEIVEATVDNPLRYLGLR